ncbi:OmpA family protein [Kaistia granuli]|uniref:OmpA family protein n=1 Tax=Kaistia granuli TaxID=363259 RepID=UPI00039F1763|nr:OmpA family protein [Kaistia granuli]
MKPSYFLLLSSVAIPVLFGGPSMALADQQRMEGRPIIVAQAAEDRVQRARELLEKAQNSLKQAEETGGDVRAARRGVADAMKDLRAAETRGGSAPAEAGKPAAPQPPKADDSRERPTRPSAGDGNQPKPYEPPAGGKKPAEPSAKPAPDRKPTPSEAKPQPPKAQPAPDKRPADTNSRPSRSEQARPEGSRNERPRPDARPPRPGDRNDGRYPDGYRDGPPQRDIFIEGPGLGDREVPPPPGYRGDSRPYRPNNRFIDGGRATERQIEDTFRAAPVQRIDRGYSMKEIRRDPRVRDMVRRVDLDSITFEFGSARVPDDQVRKLRSIGRAIGRVVDRDPGAVFLIEGHTDAVGTDLANLELSDRRAAAVAGILSDYFDIPRDALVSQGYGERYLKVPTDGPERQNRRVTIRNITPLLHGR